MHTKVMAESEGVLSPSKLSQRTCTCGSAMTVQVWESSCGGYEDFKYTCSELTCGKVVWIDGPDS